MTVKLLWNSPALPESVMNDNEMHWEIRAKVDDLSAEDSPSSNDVSTLFHRYNASTPAERDAIDAAFVWMTGYTMATICAMVATPGEEDFEETLEEWRRTGS
jgi:hypothetical protein